MKDLKEEIIKRVGVKKEVIITMEKLIDKQKKEQ